MHCVVWRKHAEQHHGKSVSPSPSFLCLSLSLSLCLSLLLQRLSYDFTASFLLLPSPAAGERRADRKPGCKVCGWPDVALLSRSLSLSRVHCPSPLSSRCALRPIFCGSEGQDVLPCCLGAKGRLRLSGGKHFHLGQRQASPLCPCAFHTITHTHTT